MLQPIYRLAPPRTIHIPIVPPPPTMIVMISSSYHSQFAILLLDCRTVRQSPSSRNVAAFPVVTEYHLQAWVATLLTMEGIVFAVNILQCRQE